MRSLLALAGFALLFIFVAYLIAMAAGALAAPAVERVELLTAADCADLPMRAEVAGVHVGQRVHTATSSGQVMSFACLSGQAGALLFVGPREDVRAVRLSELVRP